MSVVWYASIIGMYKLSCKSFLDSLLMPTVTVTDRLLTVEEVVVLLIALEP